MAETTFVQILPDIITSCSVIVAVIALARASAKDKHQEISDDAEEKGKTSVILSGINQKLRDMRDDQQKMEGRFTVLMDAQTKLDKRLVKVELSDQEAHNRIADLRQEFLKLQDDHMNAIKNHPTSPVNTMDSHFTK